MAVFVDSSFWIALRSRADVHHPDALRVGRALAVRREVLTSTDFIFAEVHAYFSRMIRLREQVISDFWDSPVIRFLDVTHADKIAAIRLLRGHRDKTYAFCDAISFVIMRRLEIKRVACFDEHFHQFGEFEVIDG